MRTANYVFANCRKFVFEDFVGQGIFDLKTVLRNIANCEDKEKLKKL